MRKSERHSVAFQSDLSPLAELTDFVSRSNSGPLRTVKAVLKAFEIAERVRSVCSFNPEGNLDGNLECNLLFVVVSSVCSVIDRTQSMTFS